VIDLMASVARDRDGRSIGEALAAATELVREKDHRRPGHADRPGRRRGRCGAAIHVVVLAAWSVFGIAAIVEGHRRVDRRHTGRHEIRGSRGGADSRR
jgi:hypothetical protein